MSKYKFSYIPEKKCKLFCESDFNDRLFKWSMSSLQVQYYQANKPLKADNAQEFLQSFFMDPGVYLTLTYNQSPIGKAASIVVSDYVPCDVISMEFFQPLINPKNEVVERGTTSIIPCAEEYVDGFLVSDNLRKVILNKDSESYNILCECKRRQFIWKLFSHLCLGGPCCRNELFIDPYLQVAQQLYKELVAVKVVGNCKKLVVRSTVVKVQLYDEFKKPLVPYKPGNPQDFLYLVSDPFHKYVAVLTNCYGLFGET